MIDGKQQRLSYFFGVIFLSIHFLLNTVYAAPLSTSSLAEKIKEIINKAPENLNVGILVIDANDGTVIFAQNADRYFMPASNQKLLTAYAAFQYLPKQFTYQTYIFADLGKVINGALNDNVYLKFSGDPTLSYAQLESLVAALSQNGIRQVNGKVVIDDTAFNQITMSPGSAWDDELYCYGAPLSASMVNQNCVSATLVPGQSIGQPAQLQFPSYPQFMRFQNTIITDAAQNNQCKWKITRLSSTTYTLTGCIKLNSPPKKIMMAINHPRSNLEATIHSLFNKYQINLLQPISFEAISKPVKLLSSVSSPPLKELISRMLKESDNTIANALFKTIGSLYTQRAGTWSNGRKAVQKIIQANAQISLPKKSAFDGAGTSRYNYLTPRQIVTLLRKVYVSEFANDYISALPVSGLDGTLKERLRDASTAGRIYAKTGTESAASGLSGFLQTKNHRIFIFTILINNFTESPAKYKTIEDQICKLLVE